MGGRNSACPFIFFFKENCPPMKKTRARLDFINYFGV
jgi:hypothetical protein